MTSDYLKARNKKINLVEIFKNWTLKSLGGGGAIQLKIATHILSLNASKKKLIWKQQYFLSHSLIPFQIKDPYTSSICLIKKKAADDPTSPPN